MFLFSVVVHATAGIMEREPSVATLWAVFLVLGSAGMAAARYRPAELWLVLPAITVLGLAQRAELFDGRVKPLILDQVGRGYFTQSYVAMGSALVLTFGGVLWRRHASHALHRTAARRATASQSASRARAA